MPTKVKCLPTLLLCLLGIAHADPLQLDPQDAALRALAYDMQRCGWRRENITAVLRFYLADMDMKHFWKRVDTDTHRPWFDCPAMEAGDDRG